MARLKIKSEPINGFVYEVQQLGALEGKRLYVQVAKLVLPALGAALKGRNVVDISIADLATIAWDEVARALVVSLDGVEPIIDTLAKTTDVYGGALGTEGAPLSRIFDDHFAARPVAIARWLVFAVKVNLADFFDGATSVPGVLAGLAGMGSPSPTT